MTSIHSYPETSPVNNHHPLASSIPMLRNIAAKVAQQPSRLRKSCKSHNDKRRFATKNKTTSTTSSINNATTTTHQKLTKAKSFVSTRTALMATAAATTSSTVANSISTTGTTTTTTTEPTSLTTTTSPHHSPHLQKLYSFIKQDPFLGPIDGVLGKSSPSFPVSSKTTTVIDTPTEFYNTLLSSIKTAKHRICLSALYLGSGEMELKLVEAVEEALKNNPDVHVLTLFDKHRGQRIDKQGNGSFNLFSRLSERYPGRVCSALYVPPCLMSDDADRALNEMKNKGLIVDDSSTEQGVLTKIGAHIRHFLREKASGRAKELFSVHHMKAYIIDDTSIISGANLSDIYFTNRQDRYLSIKNRELSDYLTGVVQTLSFGGKKNTQFAFFDKNTEGKVIETTPSFIDTNTNDWFSIPTIKTMNIDSEKAQIETIYKLLQPNVGEIFNEKRNQRNKMKKSLQSDTNTPTTTSSNNNSDDTDLDMVIYPSIQITSFGIRHDEKSMIKTLDALKIASMPEGSLEPLATSTNTNTTSTQHDSYENKRSNKHFEADRSQFFGLDLYMLTGYFNVSKVFVQPLKDIAKLYKDYVYYDLAKNQTNLAKYGAMEISRDDESQTKDPLRPFKRPQNYPIPTLQALLVAASRQGNGWWQAGGLPGHVPDIYKSIIDGFNDKAEMLWNQTFEQALSLKVGRRPVVGIHALEYERSGWSYHAKGLFVQPKLYTHFATQFGQENASQAIQTTTTPDNQTTTFISSQEKRIDEIISGETGPARPRQLVTGSKPLWTTVGSSNYGYRSLKLDSELQLSLLIPSQVHRDLILTPTQDNNTNTNNAPQSDQPDIIERMNGDLGNSVYHSEKKDKVFVHPIAYALRPIVKFFL